MRRSSQDALLVLSCAHAEERHSQGRRSEPGSYAARLREIAYRLAPRVAAREDQRIETIRLNHHRVEEDSYGSAVR